MLAISPADEHRVKGSSSGKFQLAHNGNAMAGWSALFGERSGSANEMRGQAGSNNANIPVPDLRKSRAFMMRARERSK
jgi:hypothetical protein